MLKYNFIDKLNWEYGIWTNEPDMILFEYEGYDCLIRRNPKSGILCGYVGLDKESVFYSAHYNCHSCINLEVHGGLTFSGFINFWDELGDLWWIGFDCFHGEDLVPITAFIKSEFMTYKSIAYVYVEIKKLVRQIKEHEA